MVRQFEENVGYTCLVIINTTIRKPNEFEQTHMKHVTYIITSNHGIYGWRLPSMLKWPPNTMTTDMRKVHAFPVSFMNCVQ